MIKVIADSISPEGKRLTTLECTYWRAIHAELMTHRMFSRNAASSRAIPFYKENNINCTYGKMLIDPFIPEFIGTEQKGMQSGEQLSGEKLKYVQEIIEEMLHYSMKRCRELFNLGVHKSIINRYLEPWSCITTLISATEWNNFFALRIHPAAEKHFNKLAVAMKEALDKSVPVALKEGDWHLPYIDRSDWNLDAKEFNLDLGQNYDQLVDLLKKVSVARCSRLSYLTQDGKRSINKDLEQFDRLVNPGDGVMHASPFEHIATPSLLGSGNFKGWKQYRHTFNHESVPG